MCGTHSHWPSSCSSSLQHNHGSSQTKKRHRIAYGTLLLRYSSGQKASFLHGVAILKGKDESLSSLVSFKAGQIRRPKGGFQLQDFGPVVSVILPKCSSRVLEKQVDTGREVWRGVKLVKTAGGGGTSLLQLVGPPQVRHTPSVKAPRENRIVYETKAVTPNDVENGNSGHAFKIVPDPKKARQAKGRSFRSGDGQSHQQFRPRGNCFSSCSEEVTDVLSALLQCRNDSGAVDTIMEKNKNILKSDISGVLTELQQRQEWKWTLEFFSWMKKQTWYVPNARQYTKLIGFLGRMGKVDLACLYFQEMLLEKCKPDQYTFTAMLNAYGKAKMYNEALAVFTYMKDAQDQECKPNTVTCNAMIDALVKGGEYELAVKLFMDMREGKKGLETNCSPNIITYNILIDALCKENLVKAAIKILYQMSGEASEHAVMPNVATYNTLINACGKSGMYEKAEELMEHMQGCGVEPDRITYTALIDAYGKAGECESAENLFKGMKGSHVQVDVMAFTAMIDAYAGVGLHEKALELFEMMCDSGVRPNQVTYLALMDAYAKAGLPDEAKKVFMSMESNRCQPNVLHYSALIDAYGKAGLYKEAAAAYRKMKRSGVKPNLVTLSALLAAATRCESWEGALVLIACLEHSGTELERGLCTLLLAEESMVWENALTPLEQLREPKQVRQSLYNSLMDVMWRFKMTDKAAKVLAVCKQHGIYADEYTSAEWNVDLHGLSVGGAMTALLAWLSEVYLAWLWGEDTPVKVRVITGKGKHSRSKTSALKAPVESLLLDLESPFTSKEKEGYLAASGDAVKSWLLSPRTIERINLTETEVPAASTAA
ncbi:hypothetical protein R1flu_028446 [Riccia fluitans]|uniref:Smr domain-containing protein n=1 Tax=Riccia fluitans TaxID=41844 RepID=A0ABD1XMB7_9MARC